MRRLASVVLSSLVLVGLLPGIAAAASTGGPVAPVTCSDGSSFEVNFGSAANNSSTAFVGTNTVYVIKHFEIEIDGTLISWDRGIVAFDSATLLTCSGITPGFNSPFTMVGYLTPRS